MKEILTIIVTYNGMKWIEKCLNSVKTSSVESDLFIIDNGSTDGTREYIKSKYKDAIIVESTENLGFGKANNIGFSYALKHSYRYVYLLNQDAWISNDTFKKLIDIFNRYKEYGILSPIQVNRNCTKLDINFNLCCPKDLISDSILNREKKEVYDTNFVMAAHWMIKIETLHIVGGFSPIFPHYGEDDNYLHRLIYHNRKVGIVTSTYGVHDRENRILTKEKKRYLYYTLNLALLSNPNDENGLVCLIKNYLKSLYNDRSIKNFKNCLKLLKSYRKIKTFKNLSKKKGAFLKGAL